VLAGSLARHHPELRLQALLTDEIEGRFDPATEPFSIIALEQLAIPDLAAFRRRYSRKQIAAAAKPFLLEHALDLAGSRGAPAAIFLDPDVLVLSSLARLFDHVARHAVTLTPHLLEPLAGADRFARELVILQAGTLNAGFVGVTETPSARAFLHWWQRRVERHCRHDVAEGIYYDQRWLDLAPVFFNGVSILRDPACNVAHWNLPERSLRVEGGEVLVDGRPCLFFHFSGFEPGRSGRVTRYSPRLDMSQLGPAAELFRRYGQMLVAAGYDEAMSWPYAYDSRPRRIVEAGVRAAASLMRRRGGRP